MNEQYRLGRLIKDTYANKYDMWMNGGALNDTYVKKQVHMFPINSITLFLL